MLRQVSTTLLAGLLAAALSPVAAQAQRQEQAPFWQTTDIEVGEARVCWDALLPETVVVLGPEPWAYDLATGARESLGPNAEARCHVSGLAFVQKDYGSAPIRYTRDDPAGVEIEGPRMPDAIAEDGSWNVYSVNGNGELYHSADGGLSWEQRGQEFAGQIFGDLALLPGDGRGIYALLLTPEPERGPLAVSGYALYFSPDAGLTWEQRAVFTPMSLEWDTSPSIGVMRGEGGAGDLLMLGQDDGPHSKYFRFSNDGGRSFGEIAGSMWLGGLDSFAYTAGGLLRISTGSAKGGLVSRSADGQGWEAVDFPLPLYWMYTLRAAPGDGGQALAYDTESMWYTWDGGWSWREVGQGLYATVQWAPTGPARALAVQGGALLLHRE